jgi:hypothetical protein
MRRGYQGRSSLVIGCSAGSSSKAKIAVASYVNKVLCTTTLYGERWHISTLDSQFVNVAFIVHSCFITAIAIDKVIT